MATIRQRWLNQVLVPYISQQEAFFQIEKVLDAFNDLSIRTDTFTHDDGRTQLLICIYGTIPITYGPSTYHIPINVWIPFDFPRNPPIVYIVPTERMYIRASKNVDANGRVIAEYIKSWEVKSEVKQLLADYTCLIDLDFQGCNLLDLLETLQAVFSQTPPVFNKPSPETPRTTALKPPTPSPSTRPPPPPPSASISNSPPPLPVKPTWNTVQPQPRPRNERPVSLYERPPAPIPSSGVDSLVNTPNGRPSSMYQVVRASADQYEICG
jgi:ESCRT-I complex subunit TSG101